MTHREIKDPLHRKILANELMVFRRLAREKRLDIKSDFVCGAIIGFETALRRLEMAEPK